MSRVIQRRKRRERIRRHRTKGRRRWEWKAVWPEWASTIDVLVHEKVSEVVRGISVGKAMRYAAEKRSVRPPPREPRPTPRISHEKCP